MKISGFTFVRNATKYYYPIRESIASILPILDEFVIALGQGDESDRTEEDILSLNSPKIRIIRREWDPALFSSGLIYSHETNFALSQCTGDWCFYLQADEAVHEKYLEAIQAACLRHKYNLRVDGFLFRYRHFWGDYAHVVDFHGWYEHEIRIVRNNRDIYSLGDAQSFRKGDGEKLNVVSLPAEVYHYGWVRPPSLMSSKKKEQETHYWNKEKAEEKSVGYHGEFSYGNLSKIPLFEGSHPKVMEPWINKLDWQNSLKQGDSSKLDRPLFKHEKLKYRLLTWLENTFLGGRRLFGYRNWKIIGRER